MPNDLPPWATVYQQARRWLAAGCFDALRAVLRLAAGRTAEPSAAILDSRTLRSTPESGEQAGHDGARRRRGLKLHMAVDTLGHLPALHITAASANDHAEAGRLAEAVQKTTDHDISLEVVKLPEARKGFVLLPRRWVVERSLACASRVRRLARDYERHASTLADMHAIAFVCAMLKQAAQLATGP